MTPFADESARCRAAQADWSRRPVRDRLRPVREFRHLLVEHADGLTAAVEADVRRPPDEVVGTDLLPVAAACKFLLAEAERVLRPKRVGGRPLWLLGTRDVVHRRPHGVVGVIGTWNYPVYLTAIPVLQALVAGNGVLWKPSELTPRTAGVLHDLFTRAGLPADLLVRLPATREAGPQLAEADVDFVHFTGSDRVGRKLAARLGERLVPSALELSGVDAVLVLADADVRLAARSAWFGATLNAGQTCLAARRVLVQRGVYDRFVAELRPLVLAAGPVRLALASQAEQAARLVKEAEGKGATLLSPSPLGGEGLGVRGEPPGVDEALATHPRPLSPKGRGEEEVYPTAVLSPTADLALCREASFAPLVAVVPFDDADQAVSAHNACPFGLGAAVFTADIAEGQRLAAELRAGAVVVNDVIVPTAHPATPFGGRGASGWGSTQGAEGLLGMTAPQVVTVRKGAFRPHVDAALTGDPAAGDVTRGLLRLTHGRTLGERWRGLRQLVRGMRRMGRGK
jgi:acyl-CoA reductase-like NAD-dependent aldehyde dehydrogenase